MKNLSCLSQELNDVITKHIEQEQCSNQYSVLFTMDENGNTNVTVDWPNTTPPEKIVSRMSVLLDSISSGKLRQHMVLALSQHGEAIQDHNTVRDIVAMWLEIMNTEDRRQYVRPSDVFSKWKTGEDDND